MPSALKAEVESGCRLVRAAEDRFPAADGQLLSSRGGQSGLQSLCLPVRTTTQHQDPPLGPRVTLIPALEAPSPEQRLQSGVPTWMWGDMGLQERGGAGLGPVGAARPS